MVLHDLLIQNLATWGRVELMVSSDTAQFVFMELVDGCLKALVNKTWTTEPPVVSEAMAMDPYVQTFLGALAHVKMVVTMDQDSKPMRWCIKIRQRTCGTLEWGIRTSQTT